MTTSRYFDDAFVRAQFTLERALSSQRAAFTALGAGTAVLAPRVTLAGADDSVAFAYLARLSPEDAAVTKIGSVNPRNADRGEATITATVHVLDARTGNPAATIEATSLTTIRTAAASALAIEQLARPDARTLGIIGSGVQARAHAEAISRVRDLAEIRVSGRSIVGSKRLATELQGLVDAHVRAVPSESAAASDIVATCTTSAQPVIETTWVRPGATVVSVGAFAPDRVELPVSLLERAERVVVDHAATTAVQSGSVLQALAADPSIELAELGGVLLGRVPGRSSRSEIVVYVSVGLGIQDAAAAVELLGAI